MQNYERLYGYIQEYRSLVYDYYSKDSVACLCTYYNIDPTSTIWDDDQIQSGSYERFGSLSGIKRNKILLLPVFFAEEVTTSFDGQETGYHKDNETSIVIPSTYGITPYPGDIVRFEQDYMHPGDEKYPTFVVGGIEISSNSPQRWWKLKLKNLHCGTPGLENQVQLTYVFFEYTKKIYTVELAKFMVRLLEKKRQLVERITAKIDLNSGLYLT